MFEFLYFRSTWDLLPKYLEDVISTFEREDVKKILQKQFDIVISSSNYKSNYFLFLSFQAAWIHIDMETNKENHFTTIVSVVENISIY